MKALSIFLLCAAPAVGLLLYLDRDADDGTELPEDTPAAEGPALLTGADLADPYGVAPFSGAVRQLDGFELRVIEEGYFKLYLRIERLVRHEGKPRLEEVRGAIFGPPKEGKPNLRLTLRAPFVGGDPRDLLHGPPGAPRIVTLGGGVEAFDAAGRPLAEVETLALDARAKTATADMPLVLRMPEQEAEVRAAGLDADLGLRQARLRGPVIASLGGPGGTITVRAKGGATVEEAADGAEVHASFEGDAEIEHEAGRATCRRIDAVIARREGKATLVRATLSGGVHIELAPGTSRGIEAIEMPSLAISGEDVISCEGPVHAVWRGEVAALALGRRTVRIDAASASLRLRRADDGRALLKEARFAGFAAADEDGAGELSGQQVLYDPEAGSLVLEGAVDARTPEGSLRAERLAVAAPEKGAYDLRIDGRKRIVYRAEGRLGPLGDAGRGEIRVEAAGPIRVRARGEAVSFHAEEEVVATTDGGARLRGDAVAVEIDKKKLSSFLATGHVEADDPSRGASIRGDRLAYEASAATVEGGPARIATRDGREVRAPKIVYREDGTFVANGGVDVAAPLAQGGVWRLACRDVRGVLGEGGTPSAVDASGDVRAVGPAGEEASGDVLRYDGAKGVATLLGEPARLRRGDELLLEAPKGLTLRVAEGRVVEGSSLGPATIDYRPVAAEGREDPAFRRWLVELRGPARFDGDRVVVERGARLTGSDGDRDELFAEANRVEILLDVAEKAMKVREIRGAKGVRVESRGKSPAVVTADRLSYAAGTREVRAAGNALVVAEGWPREVRFRELLFSLTKDGIDLQRASDIEVR